MLNWYLVYALWSSWTLNLNDVNKLNIAIREKKKFHMLPNRCNIWEICKRLLSTKWLFSNRNFFTTIEKYNKNQLKWRSIYLKRNVRYIAQEKEVTYVTFMMNFLLNFNWNNYSQMEMLIVSANLEEFFLCFSRCFALICI